MPYGEDGDHYEDCPAHWREGDRCRCEAVDRDIEGWYEEPGDMAEREWGCYSKGR
ncbi:hypothetical protein [Streptomyces sp. NPDC051567]|uniref:hypothetical protein n=1 Tax=Streptomyces sp. NPDC051567 TaxID=3365660 RepID=UPI0037B33672